MSAKREKRLRRLENDVAYLSGQLQIVREDLLRAQDVLGKPVQFVYSPAGKSNANSFLDRMKNRFKAWSFRRRHIHHDTTFEEAFEAAMKEHQTKNRGD